jgi:hypothetical protein
LTKREIHLLQNYGQGWISVVLLLNPDLGPNFAAVWIESRMISFGEKGDLASERLAP